MLKKYNKKNIKKFLFVKISKIYFVFFVVKFIAFISKNFLVLKLITQNYNFKKIFF